MLYTYVAVGRVNWRLPIATFKNDLAGGGGGCLLLAGGVRRRRRRRLGRASIAESAAGFLPFALRAPLVSVLHSVHFSTFFRFAANASRRTARQFGGGRRKRQLQMFDRRRLKCKYHVDVRAVSTIDGHFYNLGRENWDSCKFVAQITAKIRVAKFVKYLTHDGKKYYKYSIIYNKYIGRYIV